MSASEQGRASWYVVINAGNRVEGSDPDRVLAAATALAQALARDHAPDYPAERIYGHRLTWDGAVAARRVVCPAAHDADYHHEVVFPVLRHAAELC